MEDISGPPEVVALAEPFLREFGKILPAESLEWVPADQPHVRVPAECAEVGDLTIWFDNDEYTVAIGDLFHTHFDPTGHVDLPRNQRPEAAAKEAVSFIAHVLAGRVELCATYIDGELKWCSAKSVDREKPFSTVIDLNETSETEPGHKEEVRYRWSGRVP